jgi:hypothetical protein
VKQVLNNRYRALVENLFEIHEALLSKSIPAESRSHFCTARKEFLLGVRSLLDAAIEMGECSERQPGKQKADGAQPIPIE